MTNDKNNGAAEKSDKHAIQGVPDRIYLVVGTDPGQNFDSLEEVTWCRDPQFDTDIEYVRAALPAQTVAPADEAVAWRWKSGDRWVYGETKPVIGAHTAEPLHTRPAPVQAASPINQEAAVAAANTLERLGYTWNGGVEWKPPHPRN